MPVTYYLIKFGTVNPHDPDKKRSSTLRNAIAHNRRTTQKAYGATAEIDPTRSHLNYTIKGDADTAAILKHWKSQRAAIELAQRKPIRKNAAHATEAVFSLPAHWAGDDIQFFIDCTHYAEREFGAHNLISADVHLDETYRHCHVLFLPIVERQDGLHWARPYGNAKDIHERRERFYAQVGKQHGLKPAPKLKRNDKALLYHAVVHDMQQRNNPALQAQNWSVIKAHIASDPVPHCEALGIDIDQCLAAHTPKAPQDYNKVESIVKLMTSSRPEKKMRAKTPIRDFVELDTLPTAPAVIIKEQPLPCVRDLNSKGITIITPLNNSQRTTAFEQAANDTSESVYERDTDHSAAQWDEQLGEWVKAPVKGVQQRTAIGVAINAALAQRPFAQNDANYQANATAL